MTLSSKDLPPLVNRQPGYTALVVTLEMGLSATSEQNAIDEALGNCVKRDSDCHIIAIGPFTVGPN